MVELSALAWPLSRLGEAIAALAQRAGLHPPAADLPAPPERVSQGDARELGRWIDWACGRLGLEAEPLESAGSEFERLLRGAGPALLPCRSQSEPCILLLLRATPQEVHLIDPDLRVHRCTMESVRRALCARHEAPIMAEVDQLLLKAGVPKRRWRSVRAAILRERLAPLRLGGGWMLRLPPSVGFWRQLRYERLPQRLFIMLGVFALIYGLEIVGWAVVGRGALSGRLDAGWLLAWALLLLSLIPFQLLGGWVESMFALGTGRLLRQQLLSGALQMDLEAIRHQGAGQLLGRVIESQALESLALNGGLAVLMAVVELILAAWVLASGAGGGFHVLLLLGWLAVTVWVGWFYFQRLRRWTYARLDMTHDLVERMVGHRTCLAQEAAERRHDGEDQTIERFLGISRGMDRSFVPLFALVPRGWLLLGLLGLTPDFVLGSGTPVGLAIGLGGMLLANRGLTRVSAGLAALARAGIAWERIAPLFHAAARREDSQAPFLASAPAAGPRPADTSIVLVEACDLVFRYRPQGLPILRGCDLTIHRGERLLLEAPSGGGKSTLAALLVGLRPPESGLLLLGGLDRPTLGEGWRRLVTAAPQFHENHVLTGTFAFNLLMGRRWPATGADMQEAEDLCRELGLGELLERMPSGLMQMVGETGWQLSHGERSRLFLARALLQQAELVVLDESFAALDPETLEACLKCALKRAATLLVIAHP